MKTLISHLMLLVTGILCLNCGTPAHSRTIDKKTVETLRTTLEEATEKSKPVTIEATFDEALQLIELATGTVPDPDGRFRYAEKTFRFKDDGPGKESSHILYENSETAIILFVPETKKK
ncbi:hypothetical protein [uncultured Rikenella sp.]|uniref:hypothetical protein n=1 Tax=uncultured Rikenella sp. TaxID=368003 RepID=UPI00261D03A7|nr:hypothetical protein [uncultured Rikenella sp.]